MGTRADFYVGRGKDAEWLGSVAWDGYPAGLTPGSEKAVPPAEDPNHLTRALTEGGYRSRVEKLLAAREDATRPADGWPWPWNDSATTDYAYAFDGGEVWASAFGGPWWKASGPEDDDDRKVAEFPDMRERKKVTFGKRSGLVVMQGGRIVSDPDKTDQEG